MTIAAFHALRRRLHLAGGHVASSGLPDAVARTEAPGFDPAHLIEAPLRAIPVGAPAPLDENLSFLDGVQATTLLGHVGTHPLVAARIAAGVRRRVDRRTQGIVMREEIVVVGRAEALASFDVGEAGVRTVALDDQEPPHPLGDIDRARGRIDRARIQLELAAAAAFRASHPSEWLVVDGTITASPEWAADARIVGVIKSHAALPFSGNGLAPYLTLPAGSRSSIFIPGTRRVTPVHSWALRLRPWEGHDLFHGLVRIEVAARDDVPGDADAVSRWLLAEVAPLAADPRADRLLYGVHDVERWLRARGA